MLLFGPAILATHLLNFLSQEKKLEDTVFQVKLMVHECFILLSKHNSCDIKSSTQTAASLDSWIVSQKFSNAFTYVTFFLWLFCISVSSVFSLVWKRSWQPGTNVVRHFNRPCDIFELLERDITNSQFKGGEDLPRHLSLGAALPLSLAPRSYNTTQEENQMGVESAAKYIFFWC